MWALITVYALLCFGILFCFFGKFPGQVLAYAGMLVSHFWVGIEYPVWVLIVCGVLVVASIVINKTLVPKLATKIHEFGKAGKVGTTIGSILSIFVLAGISNSIVGLIVFIVLPYLLAFIFEMISKKNVAEGAKRGLSAYTMFAVSTLLNLIISVFCFLEVITGGHFFEYMGNSIKAAKTEAVEEVEDVDEESSARHKKSAKEAAFENNVSEEEIVPQEEEQPKVEMTRAQAEKLAAKLIRYQQMVNEFISIQKSGASINTGLYTSIKELDNELSNDFSDVSCEMKDTFRDISYKFSKSALSGPGFLSASDPIFTIPSVASLLGNDVFLDDDDNDVNDNYSTYEDAADDYREASAKFVGKINDKYEITMDLLFFGNTIRGSYYYGTGKNGSLSLDGSVEDDVITLFERDQNGNMTGKFIGEMDGKEFYGTFTNLGNGKEMPFSVEIVSWNE